jgi:hypothetical protein
METDISANPDQINPDIRVSQINPDMQIPDLKAMHLLRSTDKQSCVVLGMSIDMHLHKSICIYDCLYTCLCICICIHGCMCIHINTRLSTHTQMCIYKYAFLY